MLKGGYILMDAGGLELNDSTTQNIDGFYKRAEAALKSEKPVYVCNCEMNGGATTPISVVAWQEDAHTIVATGHVLRVTIEDDDDVTVTNLVAG